MRQTWITAPGSVEVREVAEPVPAAGEVLVEVAYAGICGSDLHTLRRGHPWLPYPIAPGHEASGVVLGGPGFAPGRRVYLRPAVSCGRCFYCARGRTNLCANLIGVGSHTPGAFAERFAVPPAALAPVPDGVSLAAAAMTEPLATAVHAVSVAAPAGLAGATVAILGGGTIGQCMLLAALGAGAGEVVLTDPVASKRDLARSLGVAATVDPSSDAAEGEIRAALGGRPDVVFDCVAGRATLAGAVRLAMNGGTVVVVGVGHGPMDLTVEAVQDHEIRIAGSAMYVAADFAAAERLIAGGAPVERLITSVRPLAGAPEALAAAAAGGEVKIHLAGPQGGA
ncbi:zinc-dependent alcohol dehydrogenase [Paractinoplanes rishiriensis]|uniref:Alcohol dehydrogenase n=1 Tax=Paractinoplanes rishiriensis TaxID=1050105 RepID=A0A919K5F4_9ACTN|nr:alcohol dehydrogenase catalytic domain-containing protein [Actinoplanes rishiriensis]GIE99929.1 alcohol dehydrogenase [Actinoplanes rishiriensis]